MKRNELKSKFEELGVEAKQELIDYIMSSNGADIEQLKATHNTEKENLQTELNTVKNKVTELEANASNYADYEELKKFKTDSLIQLENGRKVEFLKSVKCKHPELLLEKIDWTKGEYKEDKKTYEGLEEQVKSIQNNYKDMFAIETQPAFNPTGGSNTGDELTGVEKAFYANNPNLLKK